jgi:hypothetical protein
MLKYFFRLIPLLTVMVVWGISLPLQADWKEKAGDLWEQTKDKTTELTDKVEDVVVETVDEIKDAVGKKKEEPKYVKLRDVKLHLDCDNSLENEEKAKLFKTKYQGTRVIFSEMVQGKQSNSEYILNGWIGENTSISKFNCLPHVVLSGDNKIPVEEDKTYEFDCRVADFCEEGTVFDGEIRFDDCKVLKQIK